MNTVGTPLLWGGSSRLLVIMPSIDLLLQGRRGAHADETKAAGWSILARSLLFNAASGGIWLKRKGAKLLTFAGIGVPYRLPD